MSNAVEHVFDKRPGNIGQIISFGLAAAELAAILSFLSLDKLSISLNVSLISFSVSFPFLLAFGIALHPSIEVPVESLNRGPMFALYVVGFLTSAVGFGALLFHFGWLFGSIFLASIVAAVLATSVSVSA